jgi:hypothetical protein
MERIPIETGFHYDIPFAEYERWDAVNNSLLWTLKTRSPLHALYQREHDRSSPALDFGHALHTYILEPDTFGAKFAVAPKVDRRTNPGKEAWKTFIDNKPIGAEEFAADDFQKIQDISKRIQESIFRKFIEGGRAEVCIVWIDKQTGLKCKARLDYWHDSFNCIVDLKSTENASREKFMKSIFDYGYHQQAAFYTDGVLELLGFEPEFEFFPIEKQPPYAFAVYAAHENLIRAGRNSYRKALEIYAQCEATGNWPGYPDELQYIDLPQWALAKEGIGREELLL